MASIDKRPTAGTGPGGGSFRAGRRRPGSSHARLTPSGFIDGIRGDLAHGLYVDPAGGGMLFRSTPSNGAPGRSTARLQPPKPRPISGATPTPPWDGD